MREKRIEIRQQGNEGGGSAPAGRRILPPSYLKRRLDSKAPLPPLWGKGPGDEGEGRVLSTAPRNPSNFQSRLWGENPVQLIPLYG